MSLALYLITAGAVLLTGVYFLLRQRRRDDSPQLQQSPVPVNLASTTDAILLSSGYGRITFANDHARRWFGINGGDPDLELMAEFVRPPHVFRDLFAAEGRATFQLGPRRVEASSHRLPGEQSRSMVIVLRDMAGSRTEYGPGTMRALVALNEIGQKISAGAPLDDTLTAIMTSLSQAIPFQAGAVTAWDTGSEAMVPLAEMGNAQMLHALNDVNGVYQEGNSPSAWVSTYRQSLLVEDIDTQSYDRADGEGAFRSYIGTPLQMGDSFIGILQLVSAEPRAFDYEDLSLLEAVANQTAAAIDRAHLYAEKVRRAGELAGMQSITQAAAAADRSLLFQQLSMYIAQAIDVDMCGLLTYQAADDRLVAQPPFYGIPESVIQNYAIDLSPGTVASRIWQRDEGWYSNWVRDEALIEEIGWLDLLEVAGIKNLAVVPMMLGNRHVGLVQISNPRHGGDIGTREMEQLRIFASQAAIVVESVQLADRVQRRRQEFVALQEMGQAIGRMEDFDTVYTMMAGNVARLLGVEMCGILMHDPAQEALVAFPPFFGVADELLNYIQIPVTAGSAMNRLWQEGEFWLCNDLSRDPLALETGLNQLTEWVGLTQVLLVPLVVGGRPIGAVLASNKQSLLGFNEDDARLLNIIAAQMSVIVENNRLLDQVKDYVRESDALSRIAAITSGAAGIDAIIHQVLAEAAELFDSPIALVDFLDESTGKLRLLPEDVVGFDLAQSVEADAYGVGFEYSVVVSGRPFMSNRLAEDGRILAAYRPAIERLNLTKAVMVPLRVRGQGIGELVVANRLDADYTQRDVDLLSTAANQLSAAIERLRLYEETDETLRTRVSELDALGRVSNELAITVELDRITEVIRQEALRVTGVTECTVVMLSPSEAWADLEQPEIMQRYGARSLMPDVVPVEQRAIEDRQVITVVDYADHDLEAAPAAAVSALAVPILYNENAVGVIHLYHVTPDAFDERAVLFINSLALKAATAYVNAASFREQISRNQLLSRRVEQLNQIFELGQVLRTETRVEDYLEAVAHAVQMSVGYSVVMISLLDEQAGHFQRVAQAGIPLTTFDELQKTNLPRSRVEGMLQEKYRISQSYFLPAEQADEWQEGLTREDFHYHQEYQAIQERGFWNPEDALVVPLRDSKGELIGILSVDAPSDGRRPIRSTLEPLEIFVHQAAIGIENFRLLDAIQREAAAARHERDLLERLYAVSSEIQQASDVPSRLQVVAAGIQNAGWQRVHISLRDEQLEPTALVYAGYTDEEADRLHNSLALGTVWRARTADPDFYDLTVGVAYYLRYDAPWVIEHLREGAESESPVAADQWHPDDELYLPIYGAENRLIGLIGMDGPVDGLAPTVQSLRPIELFAAQAANAIEMTRLYLETSRAAEQESLFNEIMQAVTSTLDIDGIVRSMAEGLQRLLPFTRAMVGLSVQDKSGFETLEAAFMSVAEVRVTPGPPLPAEGTMMGQVFREVEGRIVFLEDETADESYADLYSWQQRGERTTMLVPMVVGGNVLGVLRLGSELSNAFAFDDENMILVQRMANLVAVAIENARLYQETAERERFSNALARLSGELNATLDLSATLESICRESLDILRVEGAYIWQATGNELVGIAGAGPGVEAFRQMRVPRDDNQVLAVRAFNQAEPLYVNEVAQQQDVRVVLAEYLEASAIMSVPLMREGSVLGVLSLVETDPKAAFSSGAVERAAIFATQASIALENARLYQETRDLQRFTTAIVESIQQGIVVMDRNGMITTFNEYMHQQYDWNVDAEGKHLFDYRETYRDIMADGLESVLTTGQPSVIFNVPGRASDKRSIVQNFYLYPLQEQEEEAEVTGVVLLVEDVTQRAMLEADLAERADQLAALTDVSSRLTATLEPDQVITLVLDQLGQVLAFDGVTLWLRFGDNLRIASARGYDGTAEELVGLEVAIEDSALFQDMAAQKRAINVPDVTLDARFPGGEQRPTRNWLGAPLISKEEIIGLLALDKVEAGYYNDNHVQLALAFANQAAVALENANLFAETRQRAVDLTQQTERLSLLNRVSTMLAQSLDLENIFEVALQESARALNVTSARAAMFDAEQNVGVVVVEYPRGDAPPSSLLALDDNPAIDYVRRTLQPLMVEDAAHDPLLKAMQDELADRGVHSLVIVPLNVGGQVIGVLILESTTEQRRFTAEHIELAQTIASQAAIAAQNANLLEQSFVRTRELETLFEASQATSLSLDLDEVIQSVGQQMIHALDADTCAVMLWDEVEQNLIVHVDVSRDGDTSKTAEPGTRYPESEYPARVTVLRGRRVVMIRADDESADERERAEMAALGSTFRMLVPLVRREESIGLIKIEIFESFRSFGLSEQRIARTLAGQAAVAIENARLNSETAAQVQEAFLINDLSRAVSAAMNLTELQPIVRTQIPVLTQAHRLYLVLRQEDALEFLVAVHHDEDIDMSGRTMGSDEFSWIINNGRSLLLVGADLEEVKRILGIETAVPTAKSFLGVPLTVGNETVGVLAVADDVSSVAFGLNDQRILSTVAGQLAVAVQNTRLFEELRSFNQMLEQRVRERTEEVRDERDRLNTLYTITAELSATLDMDRVLDRALDLLAKAVEADQGRVMLIDHQNDRLVTRAMLGGDLSNVDPGGGLRTTEGLAGWIIQNRQSVVVVDVQQDPRWLNIAAHHDAPRATIGVLLETSDEIIGVLMLHSLKPGVFNEDHVRLVAAAANQLATSINNAELYLFIREQAERLGDMVREQQIEASKSTAILEGVADGVMVANELGEVILFNNASERILAIDRQEILGRSFVSLSGLYGGGGKRWGSAIEDWMADPGQITAGVYVSEILEIGDKVVNVALSPVHMGDQFLGTVSVFRDITREVEVDRMKTEFISNVSHELRTPMTSIKGYADLLVMGAAGEVISERQREFLSIIKNNADRLGNLVNDLLNISHIDSGSAELNFQAVDVGQIARTVIANLRGRIEADGRPLTIEADIAEDLLPTYGDAEKLTQIVTNLTDNAYQYTSDGGKITVVARQQEDQSLLLSVADTGIGIPKKDHNRVFDRFYRNDENALVMETPGTGLGLAIVKELVEMHGGRIWFDSVEQEGTTFHLALPAYLEPAGQEEDAPLAERKVKQE